MTHCQHGWRNESAQSISVSSRPNRASRLRLVDAALSHSVICSSSWQSWLVLSDQPTTTTTTTTASWCITQLHFLVSKKRWIQQTTKIITTSKKLTQLVNWTSWLMQCCRLSRWDYCFWSTHTCHAILKPSFDDSPRDIGTWNDFVWIIPRKINMEPDNTLICKGKSSSKLSFSGSMLMFRGVYLVGEKCLQNLSKELTPHKYQWWICYLSIHISVLVKSKNANTA